MMKKKRAYNNWVQYCNEYFRAKREVRDAVRKAKNDEWVKLGKEELQSHFRQGQIIEILGQIEIKDKGQIRSR